MGRSRRPIFVDTSAWIALVHRRDQAHQQAATLWPDIGSGRRDIVTTDLVLAETQTLLARRIGPTAALDFTRRLLARPHRIVWNDHDTTVSALAWLERFESRPLSMTDAVSFAVMDARGIREAFTFDRDFEDAGFVVSPRPAR